MMNFPKFKMQHLLLLPLSFLIFQFSSNPLVACNRGGPMGLASKEPGMLSVNIIFSPTFAAASTSGTSGCKQWNLTSQVRRDFVENNWAQLREESSKGQGEYLAVFSDVMGCGIKGRIPFGQMLKEHYPRLYLERNGETSEFEGLEGLEINADQFLEEVQMLIRENQQINCTG